MRKDLEEFMDNREKRIDFAWMAIEGRKDRKESLKKPPRIEYELWFLLLAFCLLVLLCTLASR